MVNICLLKWIESLMNFVLFLTQNPLNLHPTFLQDSNFQSMSWPFSSWKPTPTLMPSISSSLGISPNNQSHCFIFNLSLSTDCFPTAYKCIQVLPISPQNFLKTYKHEACHSTLSSLCLSSYCSLSFLSQTPRKTVYICCLHSLASHSFLNQSSIWPPNQQNCLFKWGITC